MKKQFAFAAFSLFSIVLAPQAHALGENPACPDPDLTAKKIRHLAAHFSGAGSCTKDSLEKLHASDSIPDKAEDVFAAILSKSPRDSLAKFQELKQSWLINFDSGNPYTLEYELKEFERVSNAYIRGGGEESDLGQRIDRANAEIAGLHKAVEAMRPVGRTNPSRADAIRKAIQKTQGAIEQVTEKLRDDTHGKDSSFDSLRKTVAEIDASSALDGLDELELIYTCRGKTAELRELKKSCVATAPSPAPGVSLLGDAVNKAADAANPTPNEDSGAPLAIYAQNDPSQIPARSCKSPADEVSLDGTEGAPTAPDASAGSASGGGGSCSDAACHWNP